MKSGDLVKRKESALDWAWDHKPLLGLFMGLKTTLCGYEFAEVLWFDQRAPDGGVVSTIQPDLIEVFVDNRAKA